MFKPFRVFPDEGALIGQILTGWSEVEHELCTCVGEVMNDHNAAVRLMYRLRGENARVEIADAILRPAYEAANLKNEYEAAIGALRHSKTLRNQYAHSHWIDTKAGLFFIDLEKGAKTHRGDVMVSGRHVDVPLLMKQEQYLTYASDWLWYLRFEHQVRVGKSANHKQKAPKIIEQPPLHNPIEKHPFRPSMIADEPPPKEAPAE
jgi:hypothetical protein